MPHLNDDYPFVIAEECQVCHETCVAIVHQIDENKPTSDTMITPLHVCDHATNQ